MFPDSEDKNSFLAESSFVSPITEHVALDLGSPVPLVDAGWVAALRATMPVAAIDEYDANTDGTLPMNSTHSA